MPAAGRSNFPQAALGAEAPDAEQAITPDAAATTSASLISRPR
jgi:hypothetical protein